MPQYAFLENIGQNSKLSVVIDSRNIFWDNRTGIRQSSPHGGEIFQRYDFVILHAFSIVENIMLRGAEKFSSFSAYTEKMAIISIDFRSIQIKINSEIYNLFFQTQKKASPPVHDPNIITKLRIQPIDSLFKCIRMHRPTGLMFPSLQENSFEENYRFKNYPCNDNAQGDSSRPMGSGISAPERTEFQQALIIEFPAQNPASGHRPPFLRGG
ncbi:MAG: hypothetical protein LBQ79_01380 [Deltaproteobacteria bacterium]|jgi:hypothetical protein|nr:hypothetical protein [Deltaproteobacteria bacterium]